MIASQCNSTFAIFAIFAISVSQCFAKFRKSCFASFANASFARFRKCLFRSFTFVSQDSQGFWLKFFFLLQNPVLYVMHMESVLGRPHCVRRVIREQSPLESPALCPHPQVRRGALRRARRSLRGRPCPRHPPPPPPQQAAALCLPAPPSLRPITVLSVRHWQKGITPVLSVIRRRALAMVADCGISTWRWLPWHALTTHSKRATVLLWQCY